MNISKNDKIVVTGGNGFLGKHVINKLYSDGFKNIFSVSHAEYDLINIKDINRMYDVFKPEIVIHLAAKVGGIKANMDNPGSFFYDNLLMGVQLIEEARIRNIKKFVAIGSICSYPKITTIPFREENLWEGYPEETNAPYGLAKKMLLIQSQAYRQQYNFNSIFLLPVNLYGIYDNFKTDTSHVVPALIRKCYEAKKNNVNYIQCWGTGNASREFLYVEDAAEGIVLAMKKYNLSNPINLGSGQEISIKDLVLLICKEINFNGDIIWDKTMPDGQPRRCLDVSRAKKYFDFQSKTPLEEGIKKTIKWYIDIRENNIEYQ